MIECFLKRCFKSVSVGDFSNFLGDCREEETPDPIPNSEVKLFIADGTVH